MNRLLNDSRFKDAYEEELHKVRNSLPKAPVMPRVREDDGGMWVIVWILVCVTLAVAAWIALLIVGFSL